MEVVEQRVADRMEVESRAAERQRSAAARRRDKETERLTRAIAEFERLSDTAADLTANEQPIPDALVARLLRVNGRAMRFMKAGLRHANDVARARAILEALGKDEFTRRVTQARKLNRIAERRGVEPVGKHAAEVVLIHAGKALHYTEITRQALETGLIKTKGKTPKQTISAYLTRAVADGDTFVKVEPGVFDLAERHGRQSK